MKENERLTFEESLARLEEIVTGLEGGELPLEESLRLFEDGVRLARECQARLAEAERKIEVLLEGEEGEAALEPLDAGGLRQTSDGGTDS